MVTKIQRLAWQAFQTFKISRQTEEFTNQLRILSDLMHTIDARDVDFDERLVANEGPHTPDGCTAPVTYVSICDSERTQVFSMGIFVLRNGTAIPLHDHPGMNGLIKVIHGQGHVQAYSASNYHEVEEVDDAQSQLKAVSPASNVNVTTESRPCMLSPFIDNYHQVAAESGPLAFLDILSPPYDELRQCHYYKDLGMVNQAHNIHYLREIPVPSDFWCAFHPYTGPEINLEALEDMMNNHIGEKDD